MLTYRYNSVASQIWYFGPYIEYDELIFMTRYLRKHDGMIDVGANIGLYTLLAAPIVGPTGHIEAFEPGSVAADRFCENVALNGFDHIRLHRCAVLDKEGAVFFSNDWDVSNRVVTTAPMDSATGTVPAVTLDVAVAEHEYAYAKLDVEGAEHLALKGSTRLLGSRNPPVWQVETTEHLLNKMGASVADVHALFRDNGFVMAAYDAKSNCLTRVDAGSVTTNVLAIAEDRWDWVVSRLAWAGNRLGPEQP